MLCNQTLKHHILSNLERFDRQSHPKQQHKQAAVAVTIVNIADDPGVNGLDAQAYGKDNAALILTRRGDRLKNHAGQWALPGGRMDAGEQPEDTALRELAEEVGLDLPHDRIMGRLDDFTTRSGFTIKPVVVWGASDVTLTPNTGEVASVHRIPVAELMRGDAPILQETSQSEHPILLMPVGHSWIAAPTAAILYQFREVAIAGNATRVAHFEQPFFAWS